MLENFKEKFPSFEIEKFLADCNSFQPKKETYDFSYREFIKYFKNLNRLTKHDLIIGINFTYGWMPTILDFRTPKKFKKGVIILNKAKKGMKLTQEELDVLIGLFNNSLVGTSKLLHFINPKKFAIWDSRVCRYLTCKNNFSKKQKTGEYYLGFLKFIDLLTKENEYKKIHKQICKKLRYPVTKFRSAELIMYIKGAKPTKK